ncbi:phosphoribosylglycinamide formyltransferase [Noviherbaspirillum pedocola]|uniref:Phosphoribosylglycinamide formyltransferase n=1 Tax=Noviherbaspirillum pedocola TaxID=2801341 RepID=A0A934SXB9_9BURK|nr:phosphoribosylglycinamide formyltransferase [Noviherbaspirillum pedocola]MBK4737482.1 phosphoribosylglycinamide formyltransferase [Noviherbaspirillum pedocola]
MKRIVILISGRGSNMQAIVRAAREEQWPAQIVAVISNRSDAAGLEYASNNGIATEVIPSKQYTTRESFDADLREAIDRFTPDLVVLAGFMRILTPDFVAHYKGRMLNIHPSLLPDFPGLHTHQRALDAGVKEHGATVHFVTAELDHGPTVARATVPVLPGDTEDVLSARVLEQEHRLYPQAVREFIDGTYRMENGRVVFADVARHLDKKEVA